MITIARKFHPPCLFVSLFCQVNFHSNISYSNLIAFLVTTDFCTVITDFYTVI